MGEFHQKLLQSFTNFKNKYLKAADGLVFKFTKDPGGSGKYGYLNSNGEFVPFKTAHTLTRTITAGTSSKTTDMGEDHEYRYIKTNPTPSQTKTVTASRSAQTVTPDSGKLLSSVTVNKYPDADGTYGTITSNGTHDMGATNNYRYVGVNVSSIERVFTGFGSSCNFGYTTDPSRVWVAYCSTGGTFSVSSTGVTFGADRAYVVVIFTANAVHKVINGSIQLGKRSSGNVDLGGWYDTSKIGVSLSMHQFRVTAVGNNYVTLYNADNGYTLTTSYSIAIFK